MLGTTEINHINTKSVTAWNKAPGFLSDQDGRGKERVQLSLFSMLAKGISMPAVPYVALDANGQ